MRVTVGILLAILAGLSMLMGAPWWVLPGWLALYACFCLFVESLLGVKPKRAPDDIDVKHHVR